MSENVIPVTEANFRQEVLEAQLPVVADFWAPWCGPCRALGPVLEQVAAEYRDRIKFVKIDIDENAHLSHTYRIYSIPTLQFFQRGQALGRYLDSLSPSALRSALNRWLAQKEVTA